MKKQDEAQRRRKSRIDAQTMSFTCFLVYFLVKAIVLLVLYRYDNLLKHQPIYILPFILLLVANTYLMLTTGKDPGFETSAPEQHELFLYERTQQNFCFICNCRKKNRSKHCYYCGKCVRKFDHHCPWIGSCVGEKNQFKFWLLLLAHTLQSSYTGFILFESLNYYTYQRENGSFSPQFGAFAVFSFLMFCYLAFAGSLLLFHSYLLAANITTRELMSRQKCHYLVGISGNPFSKSLVHNLSVAVCVMEEGRQSLSYNRQWVVEREIESEGERSWLQIMWANQYYSCC